MTDVNVTSVTNTVTVTEGDTNVVTITTAGPQGPSGTAGGALPTGGTTGQKLVKTSNTNYDTQWITDSAGVTSLTALTDVTITSAANNDVLKYNTSTSKWINGTVAYSSLTGLPTLGTAAAENSTAFATAAQGTLANTAVQPASLGTAAPLNVATSGDATSSQVVKGNDTRLSDARTPTAHNQAWSTITSTPTTLSGYGITDGLTSSTAASTYLTITTAGTTYQPLTTNLTNLGANNVAYYLNRTNHTGTQAATTITGLATVATTNAYSDLSGLPTLGTAAAQNTGAFATAAQGTLADSAVQPADLVVAGKVIYVDTTTGSDTAAGDLETAPLKTITAALAQAQSGDCISIGAGIYTEAAPMIVPRNVSLIGDDLRATEIRPTTGTATNNLFLVDSGTRFFALTFARHQAGSFAVAFNPNANNTAIGASGIGAYVQKSPYIQNCTSYTAQDDSGLAGSTSDGTTGGGMEVDGSKCAANSPIRSMVVDSYTQVNLDGPGCLVKNDGYAQLVSFFGTFCSYHVKAETGGQVNLSNSTTDFGTYGLVADGRSATALFTGTGASAASGANQIDVTSLSTNRLGGSNRPAIGQVFDAGGAARTITGAVAITGGYTVTFYPSLTSAYAGGSISFYQRSQITTGAHTMEYVGSGTNYLALPWNGGIPIQANEIVETNGGRVFSSTTDHLGDFRVGDQFSVNGTTGEVTINTSSFNISGLNQIGPFSRDGGQTSVGVQLREVSNNTTLLASTGAADGNTAPTQLAVKSYTDGKFVTSVGFTAPISSSGGLTPAISISAATTSAAGSMSSADKTKLDGIAAGATVNSTDATLLARANHTGTQAASTITGLATVSTTGAYSDLTGRPTLGTAAPLDVAASGDASATQVVKGNDTRLTDARTPTAHNQAASTISDSTTAGRALLTAADVSAQLTALGLSTTSTPRFGGLGLGTAAVTGFELVTAGSIIQNRSTVTVSSGTYTLDVFAANEFLTGAAIAGATTINLSNIASIPSGYIWRGVLTFAYTSGTISWFTGNSGYTVKWDGGTAMTPTASDVEKVVIEVVGGTTTIEIAPLKGRA